MRTVKAFALLSIAEKALREASGTNTPLECWGCGKAGHAFGRCPQKQNKAIQERYLQKLEEWKERGGNVTRMLSANYVKYNWKDLGFQTQQQAELLCDIMSFHTSVAARRACLSKLDKHNNDANPTKVLVTRRTRGPKRDQDETDNDTTTEGQDEGVTTLAAARKKVKKEPLTLAFMIVPIKTQSVAGVVFHAPRVQGRDSRNDPLRLTSLLPHIRITIGDGDEDGLGEMATLKGCLDTCAGGNFGYQPYHESIHDHCPRLVAAFLDYEREGCNLRSLVVSMMNRNGS
jgi:hypothetical protein